jgi:hypothetical protein
MTWQITYEPATETLSSQVSGVLTHAEVDAWRQALAQAAAALPAETEFRALMDIHRYEVADQERAVHAQMREVIPLFLAHRGFVVGFWRLYEASPPAPLPGARCRAVAHVHHDSDKMARYNELLATPTEHFFDDRAAALAWLATR